MQTVATIDNLVENSGPTLYGIKKPNKLLGVEDIDRLLIRPNVQINVLSYAEKNLTHGPKDQLAFEVTKYWHERGVNTLVVLNPGEESGVKSYGSYFDSLLLATYISDMQLVGLSQSKKKNKKADVISYVDSEPISIMQERINKVTIYTTEQWQRKIK
jgi:hypothetical protein